MAVLVTSGRAKVAELLKAQPVFLAWGSGDVAWDASPIAESISAEALTAELGRVEASTVSYAEPDELGDIEVPTGRFSLSAAPTSHLYLRCDFGFSDAPDATIREVGLFIGTTVVVGLPAGQRYFVPAEIDEPGSLVALEHFPGIDRSNLVRQQFEFVLTL